MLTTKSVENAKPETGKQRTYFSDDNSDLPGFALVVNAGGKKTWVVSYRIEKKQTQFRLGRYPTMSLKDARAAAAAALDAADHNRDPAKAKAVANANTLQAVWDLWVEMEGKGLRTIEVRKAEFKRLVAPTLGQVPIDQIRRSDLVQLLDSIHSKNGPRQAGLVLGYISTVMTWHEGRSDDFVSPIVQAMSKGRGANKRGRVLSDAELKAFWNASLAWEHPYSLCLRFILLTATRLSEPVGMQWSELEGKDVWTIPAARYKTSWKTGYDIEVPLSRLAQGVLERVRKGIGGNSRWVFTTTGDKPIAAYSKFKRMIDEAMGIPPRPAKGEEDPYKHLRWTTHDLRRTARTLMARIGVPDSHAERALGHVIGGVEGNYNKHDYRKEKRAAFEALAKEVARIVS